jgi:signal transduction histidine kinase
VGIRARLLLLALGVALPLALFGAAALRRASEAGRAQLDDSIRQQAELAAVAFERWVDAQRQPLTTLSAMLEERGAQASPRLSDDLRLIVETRPHWIDLRVVDADGATLAAHSARAQPPPAALVSHLAAESHRRGGWVLVTDRTASEERPVVALAAPARSGGAVLARVDGAAVSEIFSDIKLPERAVISLYDAETRLLYRRPRAAAAVEQSVDRSPFFAEFGDRRAAAFEFESPYDGVRRVYGLARAGATDCVAVVGVPSDVLYAPARSEQNRYLLFSLLALASAVAAALFVGRALARPLLRLRETARRLGAVDLSARAPARGGGEVGELGASFNLMAEQIAEREERLKELDRLKSEFVSSVSHELRTPLTTIKTLTRVLQRGRLTDEERGEYLETIAAECDRQIDLVLNLLDLSRIESGAYRVSLARVEAAEVAEACARVAARSAQVRGVAVAARAEGEVSPALSDAGALRRVVCSLVENAIKYTDAGGSVTITARAARAADAVEIAVEDTGRGIRREDLPHVFEKFFRGRPASAPGAGGPRLDAADPIGAGEAPGVGLGLYLARSIVTQLGGEITAESPPPGKTVGALFTVRLPAWQSVAREAEEAEEAEEAKGVGQAARS